MKLVPPVSVLRSFRSLLSLPMYSFIHPLSLKCMLLRLVGIKEYGLGTQILGLNWPLSEVGTELEQQTCLSPHCLIIRSCLTAWRPRTNNNKTSPVSQFNYSKLDKLSEQMHLYIGKFLTKLSYYVNCIYGVDI